MVNYSYDPNGNSTLPGHVTGPNNQLLSDGTWNYTYDAVGNTIGKTNIQTGETWAYSYDLNNKQTLAVHKNASGTLIETVALSYDVFGQLVEEDVYEASTNQTTVSKYAWDGQGNVWADLNSSGQLVMRRVYLDGPNQPVLRIDASGNVSWYLADHLGSIVGITNASGSLIDQKAYDAWGNLTSETQPANGDRYGYAGMQFDTVLGDNNDNARRYRPSTGTFENPDPSSFDSGTVNLYSYTDNDPTNATDTSGLAEKDLIDLGGGYKGRVDVMGRPGGQTGGHIHIFDSTGKEVAKINEKGGYATRHKGKALKKPSELPKSVRNKAAQGRKKHWKGLRAYRSRDRYLLLRR